MNQYARTLVFCVFLTTALGCQPEEPTTSSIPVVFLGEKRVFIGMDRAPLCTPNNQDKKAFEAEPTYTCTAEIPSSTTAKVMPPKAMVIMAGGLMLAGSKGGYGGSNSPVYIVSEPGGVNSMLCDDGEHPCLVHPKTGKQDCSMCP